MLGGGGWLGGTGILFEKSKNNKKIVPGGGEGVNRPDLL